MEVFRLEAERLKVMHKCHSLESLREDCETEFWGARSPLGINNGKKGEEAGLDRGQEELSCRPNKLSQPNPPRSK